MHFQANQTIAGPANSDFIVELERQILPGHRFPCLSCRQHRRLEAMVRSVQRALQTDFGPGERYFTRHWRFPLAEQLKQRSCAAAIVA